MTVTALLGVRAVALILRGGPDAMRNAGPVIAIGVCLLSLYVLALLIAEVGWDRVTSAQPTAPTAAAMTSACATARPSIVSCSSVPGPTSGVSPKPAISGHAN